MVLQTIVERWMSSISSAGEICRRQNSKPWFKSPSLILLDADFSPQEISTNMGEKIVISNITEPVAKYSRRLASNGKFN